MISYKATDGRTEHLIGTVQTIFDEP